MTQRTSIYYNDMEIPTITYNNETYYELFQIAGAMGYYMTCQRGKGLYPRKKRILEIVSSLEIAPITHQDNYYINKSDVKTIISMAKTKKLPEFLQWFSKHSDPSKATKPTEAYNYSNIKTTFLSVPMEDIEAEYKKWHKYINSNEITIEGKSTPASRVIIYKKILKALTLRRNKCIDKMQLGFSMELDRIIFSVREEESKQKSLIERGLSSNKTRKYQREIERLKMALEENKTPSEEEYVEIKYHGFSCNSQYSIVKGTVYKTRYYKRWIKNFPIHQIPSLLYWTGVDFNKPIELYVEYICKAGIDTDNLNKSFIDMVFNSYYNVDDNIISHIHSKRVGVCNEFKDGLIRFYIKNS